MSALPRRNGDLDAANARAARRRRPSLWRRLRLALRVIRWPFGHDVMP